MTHRTPRSTELATVLLLTVFFVLAAGSVLGLAMSDDSSYMQNVLFLNVATFGKYREWGPLYTLWFRALTVVCRNPISRYFLSWGLLVTALGVIPAWLKTRHAWIYTLIVLAFPVFTIWPFVSLFAGAIILCSLCLLLRRERSPSVSAATACCVSFLLGFIRPEFGYGVYAGALATILLLFVERARSTRAAALPPRFIPRRFVPAVIAGCVGLCVIMLWLQVRFPNPVPRSGMAFAQHFTLRAAKQGLIAANSSNWQSDYAEQRFGIDRGHNSTNGSASIADFFHANPRLFFGHLWHNFTDPLMICSLLALLIVLLWPWLRKDARQLRGASVFLALMAIPTFAAMFLIYPRAHYAIAMFPALTILALHLVRPPAWQPRYAPRVLAIGGCIIWLLNIGVVLRANVPASSDRITLSRVQCEHTVDMDVPPANLWVFAAEPVYPIYLPRRRLVVTPETMPRWSDLKGWSTHTRPAWISTDPELAERYGVTLNQMDAHFRGELGYTAHPCPLEARLTIYTNDAP